MKFDASFASNPQNVSEKTTAAMLQARAAFRAAGLAVQYIDDKGARNEVCCTDAAHRDDFIRRISLRGWSYSVSA